MQRVETGLLRTHWPAGQPHPVREPHIKTQGGWLPQNETQPLVCPYMHTHTHVCPHMPLRTRYSPTYTQDKESKVKPLPNGSGSSVELPESPSLVSPLCQRGLLLFSVPSRLSGRTTKPSYPHSTSLAYVEPGGSLQFIAQAAQGHPGQLGAVLAERPRSSWPHPPRQLALRWLAGHWWLPAEPLAPLKCMPVTRCPSPQPNHP